MKTKHAESKPQSAGGKARRDALPPERRSEIARKAAEKRWSQPPLKATHGDPDHPLIIGDLEIPCYVLENGTSVLSGRGMQTALALGQSHGSLLKSFLGSQSLERFINQDLAMALDNPIRFTRPGRGGKLAVGYEATLLADICEAVLRARREGALTSSKELVVAAQCEILTQAFAKVGIVALVHEATGYQEDRAKDALAKILEEFISKELSKWVKTFPDEYYEHLFRLRGFTYDSFSQKRPVIIGKLTNDIVYKRLAPGVLEELKRITPRDEKGRTKHRYFQRLTEDSGRMKLREHLSAVVALMKASRDWKSFRSMLNRALPPWDKPPEFPGMENVPFDDEL